MPIKLAGLPVFLFVTFIMFAAMPTVIDAQQPQPGTPPPQLPVISPGPLPMKTLLVSEPLRLQLSGPFDLAYNATQPQTISLYVRSLPTNATPLDSTLEIDDPQGNQLAFNDDLTSDSRDAGVENVDLPTPGIYIIHLNTFDLLNGGGVEVQLVTAAQPNPNNQGAGSILDVPGKLDGKSPSDFFFTGTIGQVVTITAQAINPPSPDMDLSLTLFGPDGAQVATDDDTGGSNGLGERDPALMHFSLPQTGQYRLEVTSWFDTPGDIAVKVVPG